MPKIRNTYLRTDDNPQSVEVSIYYIAKKKTYDEPFFLITPVDPQITSMEHDSLVAGYVKDRRGIKGSTEDEAITNFVAYLKDYYIHALSKERLIFIDKERHDPYGYRSTSEQYAKIEFSYKVGYKMTLNGKEQYYEDRLGSGRDSKLYDVDKNYTTLPLTDENLARCKEIVEQFNKIRAKIQELFSDEKKALKALYSGKLLTQ
jgi:hypothetical protein